MNYVKINNLLGWFCFLAATSVYLLTMERTVSFWDCGEFIASAYKLQVVHQPGAPLFLMLENIFSNLAMAKPAMIAFFTNAGSALCSGFTILFLCWTITALARKIVWKSGTALTMIGLVQIMGAGLVGALAFAFSDTFWFSAVETEVYALASLCTAVVFWAILKWESRADGPGADRWLVLIAFIMGLSIGVHLLNLLTIPVLGMVIYLKRADKVSTKGLLKTLLLGCGVLALILWGVIQYLVKGAAYADLFFVNNLGLGFGSGILFFITLVVAGIAGGIVYSIKKAKPKLNLILLCTAFVVFGYGSFAMVLIRAQGPISLNNTDPDDAFSFLEYLGREQYASNPLFKGPYFDSRPIAMKNGPAMYAKGKTNYEVRGHANQYVYDRETLFPRMSGDRDFQPMLYKHWIGLGENETPQFLDNLKFLGIYQAGHMYARYFMWNFAGRQNDKQGLFNDYTTGNWISGIKPLDNARLGGQQALPRSVINDPSHNRFFMLPLLLGMLGAFWHLKQKKRDAGIVGLLFFFTGLAIVLYLNDTPMQPRDRDYIYAGSFYAFAIWMGLGMLAICQFLQKRLNMRLATGLSVALALLIAPVLMGAAGWDDHDRSARTTARDTYARNYLESCAPNAILFTYGDNETYPVWYAQEVEGIRPDVRVINLGLLGSDWLPPQLKHKINASEPLPLTIDNEQIKPGVRQVIRYYDYGIQDSMELNDLMQVLLSDHPSDKHPDGSGENFLPTKKLKLTVNKADVIKNRAVPTAWQSAITDSMSWTFNKEYITRTELCLFDILIHNNWERPIYFASTMPHSEFRGLDKYMVREGFAYRLMPVDKDPNMPAKEEAGVVADRINTDTMNRHMMDKFAWGNLKQAKYLDPLSYAIVPTITNGFTDLARALITEKQPEKAKKALKRCLEVIPGDIHDLEQSAALFYLADTLNELDEQQIATGLMKKNAAFITDELRYYTAIAKTKPNLEQRNIYTGLQVMEAMRQSAHKYQQTALLQELDNQFTALRSEMEYLN